MSKQFKVFLSSSFQDMHEERDYLKYHAFAALQSELYQKGWDLKILDLRGTTTQPELSQEEAVLRLCLDGVEDCIPRMVVLMGDRYGWIPYGKGAQYSDEEAKDRTELAVQNINDSPTLDISKDEISGRSVTHLEIYYGLKKMSHDDIFVYQRTGLPYNEMTDAQRSVFCAGYDAQQALKAEIGEKMAEHKQNIKNYSVCWDSKHGTVTGLEELDAMIYSDLKASLNREVEAANRVEDTWSKDSEKILMSLAKSTMPRNADGSLNPSTEFQNTLLEIIDKRGFFWVTGNLGSGVTTYTAQLYYGLLFHALWREEHDERPMLIVKYIAESHLSDLTTNVMLMQLLEQLEEPALDICPEDEREQLDKEIDASIALYNDYSDNRCDTSKKEAVIETQCAMIRRFLSILNNKYDIFIILCDIDMLAGDDFNFRTLYWLSDIPSDITVVFSAAKGSMIPCMENRFLEVPPLSAELIRNIMTNTASDYGKRFSEEIIELASNKLLSSGSSTALHARVLSECLMNMTGPDYLAFTGSDAHLSYMRHLIGELPSYVDGVFDLFVNRAKEAYGDLAIAALRLLWVSRTAIPDWIFRDTLSLNLGREVSQLELFSLKGYLQSSLKRTRELTWQLAHESFRSALIMHIGDAVLDSAASILQILRGNLSEHSFTLSEYIWYGYWAGDPTAVRDYIESFADNPSAHYEILKLIRNMLCQNEGHWINYMKSALGSLRERPVAFDAVFRLLTVPFSAVENNFNKYNELLDTYLSAATDILPESDLAELHQLYAAWRLRIKAIINDSTKRIDALRMLEETSLKSAGHFHPSKGENKTNWYSYMAEALFAQTMLSDGFLSIDPGYSKECLDRATSTFELLGDDGAEYLIESRNESFLNTIGAFFTLSFVKNGHIMTESAKILYKYIDLLEKQSAGADEQNIGAGKADPQWALYNLYAAALEILNSGNSQPELTTGGNITPEEKDDRIYAYLNRLVSLGDLLYPKRLQNKQFLDKYLKSLWDLSMEQTIRQSNYEAARTNQAYVKAILNLHENSLISEDEVADSHVYRATELYINYDLGQDAQLWREMTDYLIEMAEWVDNCRFDPLRLSISYASIYLMKVRYSQRAEDYDEQEVEKYLSEALTLILAIPERFSQSVSRGMTQQAQSDCFRDILVLLPNMLAELTYRDMINDAESIIKIFGQLSLEFLEHERQDIIIESSAGLFSDNYKLFLNDQKQSNFSVSAELTDTLLEIMEGYLEPHHTVLKEEVLAIRKALEACKNKGVDL